MANKALSFDGQDDGVEVSHSPTLNPTNAITIEAWVYMRSVGSYPSIVTKTVSGQWNSYLFEFLTDTRKINLWLGGVNPSWNYTANSAMPLNQWTYIVATWDGTQLRYFFNGSPDGSYNKSGAITANSALLYIGRRCDGYYFDGVIDEVRISDIACTPEEILANWNDGLGKKLEVDEYTVALWHIDEGEGGTIFDETENDNDGTIVGASWVDGFPFPPNPGSIETFIPNAVGTTTELTDSPSAGDNYDKVDDTIGDPDDGTTLVYMYANADYLVDTYGIPDHSEGSDTINHVKVYIRCNSGGDGYPCKAKVTIYTHSTPYYGDVESLTATWVTFSKQWDKNPNTTEDWTWDEIDALEIGVALTDQNNYIVAQCTQVYAEVDYTAVAAGIPCHMDYYRRRREL